MPLMLLDDGERLLVDFSLIPTPHVHLPKRGCGTLGPMSYYSTCSYYYVSIDSLLGCASIGVCVYWGVRLLGCASIGLCVN